MAPRAPAKRRQRRELTPGEVIAFRNKRYFFTMAGYVSVVLLSAPVGVLIGAMGLWVLWAFAGPVILGRVAFVFIVPPKVGR